MSRGSRDCWRHHLGAPKFFLNNLWKQITPSNRARKTDIKRCTYHGVIFSQSRDIAIWKFDDVINYQNLCNFAQISNDLIFQNRKSNFDVLHLYLYLLFQLHNLNRFIFFKNHIFWAHFLGKLNILGIFPNFRGKNIFLS